MTPPRSEKFRYDAKSDCVSAVYRPNQIQHARHSLYTQHKKRRLLSWTVMDTITPPFRPCWQARIYLPCVVEQLTVPNHIVDRGGRVWTTCPQSSHKSGMTGIVEPPIPTPYHTTDTLYLNKVHPIVWVWTTSAFYLHFVCIVKVLFSALVFLFSRSTIMVNNEWIFC